MQIDPLVFSFMKSIENNSLISFSKFIAAITEPMILLAVSLIIALVVYSKKSKREGIFISLVLLSSATLLTILKNLIQRARPLDQLIIETGYSFPSGHALMSLVFFGVLVFVFFKKNKIKAGIIAGLFVLIIGFTRLYLRVHWFTDVFVGYLVGVIILAVAILTYKKVR